MAALIFDPVDANNVFSFSGATGYTSYDNQVNVANPSTFEFLPAVPTTEAPAPVLQNNKNDPTTTTSSSRPAKKQKTRAIMPKQKAADLVAVSSPAEKATTNGAAGSPNAKPGRITTVACMECQRKKCKCDGAKPRCRACERKGVKQCVYQDRDDTTRSLKEKNKKQADKINELQQNLEDAYKELGRPMPTRKNSNHSADGRDNSTTNVQVDRNSMSTDGVSATACSPAQPSPASINNASYPIDDCQVSVHDHAGMDNDWSAFTGPSEDLQGYAQALQDASKIKDPLFDSLNTLQSPVSYNNPINGAVEGGSGSSSIVPNAGTSSKKRSFEESVSEPQSHYNNNAQSLHELGSFSMMAQQGHLPQQSSSIAPNSASTSSFPSSSVDLRQPQPWLMHPQQHQSYTYQPQQAQQTKDSQKLKQAQQQGFPFPTQKRDLTQANLNSDQEKYINQLSRFDQFKREQSEKAASPSYERPCTPQQAQDMRKPSHSQDPPLSPQQQNQQQKSQQEPDGRQANQSQQGYQQQQSAQYHANQSQQRNYQQQNQYQYGQQYTQSQNNQQHGQTQTQNQQQQQYHSPQYYHPAHPQPQPLAQQNSQQVQQQTKQAPQSYYGRQILLNGNHGLDLGNTNFGHFYGQDQYASGNHMTLAPMMGSGPAGPRMGGNAGFNRRTG